MNYQDTTAAQLSTTADENQLPKRRRRLIFITAGVAVAILACFVAFQAVRQTLERARLAANRPPPLSVSYEVARLAPLPQSLSGIGNLAAINGATLSAEIGGTVSHIAFEPGAHVKKGELLIQLNDASERADLESFQAQQRLALQSLQRSKSLTQSGSAARAQLDQAQSQFDVAAAGIARAQASIAKKNIAAPFDGDIGMNLIDVGEYATPGQALAMLSDNSRLYVHFSLPEQARPKLAVGQPIHFTVDAFSDEVFTGKLTVIDPEVSVSTRSIGVHGIVENTDRKLMPGMFAKISVVLADAPDVLTIPETAIVYGMSGDSAFVAQPGEPGADNKPTLKAHKIIVRTGASVNGRVVVEDGIQPGDRVLTTGTLKLFEGSSVALKEGTVLTPPATLPRP